MIKSRVNFAKSPKYVSLEPLIAPQDIQAPMDWSRPFKREAPLEVEIGFGNGEFLLEKAKAHPERNFIGFELSFIRVKNTLRQLSSAALPNVRLLYEDARLSLERLFLPSSIERVYCLFPCPWPKSDHIKFRLFSKDFLQLLNNRLTEDGEALLVTDSQKFFNWVLKEAPDTGFQITSKTIKPRFGTKFENKWLAGGQKEFYELHFKKERHLDIKLRENPTMKVYRSEKFDPARFHIDDCRGAVNITFKDFVYDAKKKKGMVLLVVTEEHLVQFLWVSIAYGKNVWYIARAEGTSVVPTNGILQAMENVYQAVLRSASP